MNNREKILNSLNKTEAFYGSHDFKSKVLRSIEKQSKTIYMGFTDILKIAAIVLIIFGNIFFLYSFLRNINKAEEDINYSLISSEYSLNYIYPDYIYVSEIQE
jgi:hypothetical protein